MESLFRGMGCRPDIDTGFVFFRGIVLIYLIESGNLENCFLEVYDI